MDKLDQLYYRNLVRGTKLKIAVRKLQKKRTSKPEKLH